MTMPGQSPASAVPVLTTSTIPSGFTGAGVANIIRRRAAGRDAGSGSGLSSLIKFAAPGNDVSGIAKADIRTIDSDIGLQHVARLKHDGIPSAPSAQRPWISPPRIVLQTKSRVVGAPGAHPHDGSLDSMALFNSNGDGPLLKPSAPSAVSLWPRGIAIQLKPVGTHQHHFGIAQPLTPALKTSPRFAHQMIGRGEDHAPVTRSTRPVLPLASPAANQIQRAIGPGMDTAGAATAMDRISLSTLAAGAGHNCAALRADSTKNVTAQAPSGDAETSQVDIDELVEKAWRKIMHKLAIERERWGLTQWH
jgi:hypothetical protein